MEVGGNYEYVRIMNIEKYFKDINEKSQEVFRETLSDTPSFGHAHHLSSCIFDFSNHIMDPNEKMLLATVSSQLEVATLNLGLGLYRQAFSSLRLGFELGLGVVHFSIYKLEHSEWLNGRLDIKWARLINTENGILSKRFADAFFPELGEWVPEYNTKGTDTYRALSEFVHGNYQTWVKSGIVIKMNTELVQSYFKHFQSVSETILFVLCCRYLKSFSPEQLDSIEYISDELSFIGPIRELLGGPKEL